jgi:glycosyltransferase involved in cell wall biosynthesis
MGKIIPKINIIFEFTPGPYGGGNQFIKALKNYFVEKGVYEERKENADILLFNSDHEARSVLEAKRKLSKKIFIHRLAGPIYLARGSNKKNDFLIYRLNKYIADGTIFQSNWSRKENYKAGLACNTYDTIITNAPDKRFFSLNNIKKGKVENKVKLIATSWSSNLRKGFEIYKYLDENLDFEKFTFTFVGNSPFQFKNIRHIPPQSTTELVKILSEHDIFITASRIEACSNSLIEAMHCGLPAVVQNDASNPEILKEGGVTFHSSNDVIDAIQKVLNNYEYYSRNIILPSIDEVGNMYYEFSKNIFDDYREGKYHLKKLNYLQYYFIRLSLPDLILRRMIEISKALIWQKLGMNN